MKTLWKPLNNGSNTLSKPAFKMSLGGGDIFWDMFKMSLRGGGNIFFAEMVFCRIIRCLFIYSHGKIKTYSACETSPKFSGEKFGHLRMET